MSAPEPRGGDEREAIHVARIEAIRDALRANPHCSWENDVMTLMGQATYEHLQGKTDMPAYYMDLALRLASAP